MTASFELRISHYLALLVQRLPVGMRSWGEGRTRYFQYQEFEPRETGDLDSRASRKDEKPGVHAGSNHSTQERMRASRNGKPGIQDGRKEACSA